MKNLIYFESEADAICITAVESRMWSESASKWRLAMAAFICFVYSTNAATYYVAKTGSDANLGTSGSPWLTINKAAQTMLAGDTTTVDAGIYSEVVRTKANGSAGSYIKFQGVNNPTVTGFVFDHSRNEANGFTVTGAGLTFAYLVNSGGHNTRVVGNVFTNTSGRAISHYFHAPYASNLWVEANRLYEFNGIGIALGGKGHVLTNNFITSATGFDALNIMSSDTVVIANTITNITRPPGNLEHTDIVQVFNYPGPDAIVSTNVVFDRNLIINSAAAQIVMAEDQEYLGNVRDWTFRNNLYANVGSAGQIYCKGFAFYNNVFYRCAQNTGSPLLFRYGGAGKGDGTDGKVFNNIFIECGSDPASSTTGWYAVEPQVISNFKADYNIVFGTGSGTTKTGFVAGGFEAHGINGQNPLFVNVSGLDFHTQSSSPCIGAGLALNSFFANDFAGVTRNGAWDIGAYEYGLGGGIAGPRTPTGLRKVDPPLVP